MIILILIVLIFLLTRRNYKITGGNDSSVTYSVEDYDTKLGLVNDQLVKRLDAAGFTRVPFAADTKFANMSIGYVIDRGGGIELYSPIFKQIRSNFKSTVGNCTTITNRENLANNAALRKYLPKTHNLSEISAISPGEIKIAKYTRSFLGTGVEVITNTSELDAFKAKYPRGVIQDYINNPLLVGDSTGNRYKFHFRVYMAVHVVYSKDSTKITRFYKLPEYRIYSAKSPFKPVTSDAKYDRASHLTNSKTSLHRFIYPDDFNPADVPIIDAKINELVATAANELAAVVYPYEGKSAFEVLGFDILFDDKLNSYILEVNNKVGYSIYGEAESWPQFNAGFSSRYYDWLLDSVILPQFGVAAPPRAIAGVNCDLYIVAADAKLPLFRPKYRFAVMSHGETKPVGFIDGKLNYDGDVQYKEIAEALADSVLSAIGKK